MIEVHILGTSSAKPVHGRSVSGNVISGDFGQIIVDCGEGFQKRVTDHNRNLKSAGMQSRIRQGRISTVLLTHGHLDHCWGLLPFLQTMSLEGRTKPLTIIGPTDFSVIDNLLKETSLNSSINNIENISNCDLINLFRVWWNLGGTSEDLGFEVQWILVGVDSNGGTDSDEFKAISFDTLTMSLKEISNLPMPPGVTINHIPTCHSVPSCAWQMISDSKRGKFDRKKCEELGLSEEEIRNLANGKNLKKNNSNLVANDFRGPEIAGINVVISGDTKGDIKSFSEPLYGEIDLLIHESTYSQCDQKKAIERLHSTSIDAANNAKNIGANLLLLTHYSSKIENVEQLVEEAKEIHNLTFAARDSDLLQVNYGGKITLLRNSEGVWISESSDNQV